MATKFQAKIVDTACLNHFAGVNNIVAELAKPHTLHISPDKLNFLLWNTLAASRVSTWCELEQ